MVHDVTLRKRAEHDLHDSTGQTLAALELGLSQLLHDTHMPAAGRRELIEHCA